MKEIDSVKYPNGKSMPEDGLDFLGVDLNKRHGSSCVVCAEDLTKKISYRDFYGTLACVKHGLSICSCCGRFIVENPIRCVGINGVLCQKCFGPRSESDLVRVYNEVAAFIYDDLRIYVPGVHINLLDAEQMYNKYEKNCVGVAHKKNYVIDILSNQSELALAKTLIHEMLHIWQYFRGIRPQKSVCEGFCNLGAYLFVQTKTSDPDAHFILKTLIEDSNIIYGDGFRRLKVLYDMYGREALLASMYQFKQA